MYAYEKSYHYFLPLAQEINDTNSDQNSIKLKNGVVNIGLLCFERNLSKSEFIEIGDIIGLDGYKLKDVKRLKNSEVPAVDLNYYIPILVTNENKIFPIMSFEVWHRIHLTKKDTQASHFLASPMNGAFYLMRDIAKQIHFENEDKDDVRCDIGYIFYKRYPDGYGILLRETGKTPLIYDPYRDLKMPEYKLDPDYIGVYRENPK